ncbi:MAG: glutathione peroxidase, partial [Raoultibacter sp.]
EHELTPILKDILAKENPEWEQNPDIKWNFTKFLIDREGNVVSRFEPTADIPSVVTAAVEKLL